MQNDKQNQEYEMKLLQKNMSMIKNKIIIMSGKGGVGKSTVAVNLAVSLALAGHQVGLLDVDIHGPSIPKMLHLEHARLMARGDRFLPIQYQNNIKVISIGFMLPNDSEAVIWRGPRKYGVIKQFLGEVAWEELDYLIVDAPPGTGDEPMAVCQLMGLDTKAIIVTTPQPLALTDVRKSVTFCEQLNIKVLGIIENMSGFTCPHCHKTTDIFKTGGGEKLAREKNVAFLGSLPIDPQIVEAGDEGEPFIKKFHDSETCKRFGKIILPLLKEKIEEQNIPGPQTALVQNGITKIAIPVAQGKLCAHFGHCENFALIDVDMGKKSIIKKEFFEAPDHQPGLLPPWLAERGANIIVAGGMGARAQSLFSKNNIKVIIGAPSETPEKIVQEFLNGSLIVGENICDH
ncbi:MAG: iron-sulfur cluster carrier protein MrpORP [bacterium]